MNAVNLIPNDRRGRRRRVSASPATLALVGGLLLVLVAAVVYVSAVKDVRAKRSQLARVTAATSAWNAAAARFDATVQEVQQRSQELTDVKQLAGQRFPWSRLLGQIGGVMPADAALSSMTASTTSSSATPTAAPTSTAAPVPTVQLSGCAASQSAVAQTMVQLHRVTGVSAVTLSSTTASGSGSSGGSGSCGFPVQFQISLTFTAPATSAATPAAGTTATAAAATTSTTPAASAAAPSTGAAQ